MTNQKGNTLLIVLSLGALLIGFFTLVFLCPRFLKSSPPSQTGSGEGTHKNDSSEMLRPGDRAGEWKVYKNAQLGFQIEYPVEKQFEITLAQNKVSFMVPYTKNGFTIEAFDNPEGLESSLWLEKNFSLLYKNETYKGQPLTARDSRQYDGKFYVGDKAPIIIDTEQFAPTLYVLNINNVEKSLGDRIVQSLKRLSSDSNFSIDTQRYVNEALGVEFIYPPFATIEEKDDQVVVWQGKPPTPTGTDAPPAVAHVGFSTFKNDHEWEKSFASQEKLKEHATEMKFLGAKTVRLPNAVGAQEYSYESDLGKWQALYVWQNNKIYRINYSGSSFFTTILKTAKFF